MTDQTDPSQSNPDQTTPGKTAPGAATPGQAASDPPDQASPPDNARGAAADSTAPRRLSASRDGTPRARLDHPHFSQPVRQILLMLVVLALVGTGAVLAYGRIWPIFAANMWLNGAILAVFALGVLTCFWQVAQLVTSVSWIERFAARRKAALSNGIAPRSDDDPDTAPRLLAPLAALLGRRGPLSGVISTGSARSILDSVETRIDEARDITRYVANLLIFLGLLGTFYGLATTVPAVVETIRALAPAEGETGIEVFDKLMTGLEAQLGGMGTAFSSSLLGLAGSLIVGLLELFVTHGQNRFFRELEEWMSGFTRISLAGPDGEGVDHNAIAAFLDQLAEQTQNLQLFYAERDDLREQEAIAADERALVVARGVTGLTRMLEQQAAVQAGQHQALTDALAQLVAGQNRLVDRAAQPAPERAQLQAIHDRLARLVEQGDHPPADAQTRAQLLAIGERVTQLVELAGRPPEDAQARMHLRSIDDQIGRMLEENASARADMMAELRSDLAILQQDIRALGGDHGA
ncbi:hypothetical protein [Paracoccus jiaweipingae]|uniref:hypothetical protein n=1 Tax=unclassified Paracoccus (in: a-proteobacteria) TaxID=2688777 RepID=UPI0037BA61E5